jgi:uncharacterized protein YegP (UPF0339 family)
MATATKKAPAATSTARAVRPAPVAASISFLTYRDNDGSYHWEIVDASGEALAHSGNFISQDDAESAARAVSEGVRSSDFEPQVGEGLRAVAV